jgi:hypothetical protein
LQRLMLPTGTLQYVSRRILPAESRTERLQLLLQFCSCRRKSAGLLLPCMRFAARWTTSSMIVDMVARSKLAWWRKELQAMLNGEPTHPVTSNAAAYGDF